MAFAMHQHELALGTHMSLPLKPLSSTFPLIPPPLGGPRALALGSCIIHRMPTGNLFYIW